MDEDTFRSPGFFSQGYGYSANPTKTCVEEVRFPDVTRLTILKNNERNIKAVLVSEIHHTQKVLLAQSDKGPFLETTIMQNNSISRLYRKIDEQLSSQEYTRFLGLIEMEAQESFLLGGNSLANNSKGPALGSDADPPMRTPFVGSENVVSLDIAQQNMIDIKNRFLKKGLSGIVISTDIRQLGEDQWKNSLLAFPQVSQQGSLFFAQNCDEKMDSLLQATETIKDIFLNDSKAETEITEKGLSFTQEVSRFMKKPLAQGWKSEKSLNDIAKNDTFLTYLLSLIRYNLVQKNLLDAVRQTLQQQKQELCSMYPEDFVIPSDLLQTEDDTAKEASETCEIKSIPGVTPAQKHSKSPIDILAAQSSRAMDFNILQWIREVPNDTFVVVHAGAGHTAFLEPALCCAYNFHTEEIYVPIVDPLFNFVLQQVPTSIVNQNEEVFQFVKAFLNEDSSNVITRILCNDLLNTSQVEDFVDYVMSLRANL